MSAAFSLKPDESRCGFPNCIGAAFHAGDHEFPQSGAIKAAPVYTCSECGAKFVVYGERITGDARICGSHECIASLCRRELSVQPLRCSCPQREYAHDVTIHATLRREAYDTIRRYQWPWALVLADRLEPSTESQAAAAA